MTEAELQAASRTLCDLKAKTEDLWATAPSAELVQLSMESLTLAMDLIIAVIEGNVEIRALREELGEQPGPGRITH